jgi:hypothetical protein
MTDGEEISQIIGFTILGGRGREFGTDEGGQLVSSIRKRTWDWSWVVGKVVKEKVK